MATKNPRVRDVGGYPRSREAWVFRRRAVSERESESLEALFRDAGPELWRAIYGFTGGRRQLTEDAVAEAFARADRA